MSYVCIIESDAQFTKQIELSIKEIDSQLEILSWPNLEGFHNWFSQLIKSEKQPKLTKSLKLIIADMQFLGPRYFSLIEKMRKTMVRKKILLNEEDLAVLLTTFDSPVLDLKQIESRIITNILFKPFDPLMLKQHLLIALSNQKNPIKQELFTQKLNATGEMLKDVQLESFTELGFTTRSNRPIPLKSISKYYSRHFETNDQIYLIARCVSCRPYPNVPDDFLTEFRYFGIRNSQIKKLRQELFTAKNNETTETQIIQKASKNSTSSDNKFQFLVFLKSATDPSVEIKDAIEQNISNVNIQFNRNITHFLESLAKDDLTQLGTHPIHVLVLHSDYFTHGKGFETWSAIIDKISQHNKNLGLKDSFPKVFLTSHIEIPESKLRNWTEIVSDVVMTPIDRPYLSKRLVTLFPDMQPRSSAIEIHQVATNEIIRVANPIQLTSLSEASLTMRYYRPISFHSFRRFCLPSSSGAEAVELLASCYFSEKRDSEYINHFVFFGITDKYLKYIRKWILEQYFTSKNPAA